MTAHKRPLHDRLPQLAARVPHVPLARLPTPLVERAGPLGECLCKLDGQTHDVYGGNKVRKLEYVLAQAQRHGAARVATFGAAGSNHATATAIHARALGLGCVSFLSRQRPTPWVAANLRRQHDAGADIVFVSGHRAEREAQARAYVNRLDGATWRIPMGGSSLAGTLGYVNAGLELAQQFSTDRLPDRVYVPLGTMGTAVGIALGFALAGRRVPVHAVRVVHPTVGSSVLARRLWTKMNRLLRTLDPSTPDLVFDAERFIVRDEYFGDGYAAVTPQATAAVAYAADHLQLSLETTYSGKALGALLDDAREPAKRANCPLLVCTYQSGAPAPGTLDARELPEELQTYLA